MTRVVFLVSALVTLATGVAARDVTVRSGEHDGYSRLVVQVPPGTEWGLKQTKNGARLNVALEDVVFQTGSVFQRLSQDRLAAISQPKPGAALELEFGCDCNASAFLFKDTMIVVDIAPSAFPSPIARDIPPLALPVSRAKDTTPRPDSSGGTLALPLLNLNTSRFQDQLSTRLVQGVDRGIVDLSLAPVGPRASADNQNLFIPRDLELNVSVTSVLDDLNGLLGPDIPQFERHPPCISSAELAFEDWADARPFVEQTAQLRSDLFLEFDAIDQTTALKLAKLYAYFGFGAESIRALELLDEQSSETKRIAVVARALDDASLPNSNPFAGLQRCNGDAAMWAALTEGHLQDDANLIAIERTFARLPDHLRRQIGPLLSDTLVNGHKIEAARRVLRSVDRVMTQTSASTTQAKAKVAKVEGDTAQSEALLTEIISSPDATLEAPLALARLVDKRWSERGAISPRELELAASYAIELRRANIGLRMRQTHAVALSLGHEFDAALDLVADLPENAETTEALNRVAILLTERADDTTFLRRTLTLRRAQSQNLSTDVAIAIADRLALLGFSQQALTFVNRPQDKLRRGERARLRARAALLDQRPHQAILELADDRTEEANDLRTAAMQEAGDYAAAGKMMLTKGKLDEANRFFWLADQPNEAHADASLKYGRVVGTTLDLTAPPLRLPDKQLADAESLLHDSVKTRQRIEDLFATLDQE